MPEYKFVWFGYSDPRTIPAKVRKAVNTKLPNLFFPGYINRDELKEAYGGADLFMFMTKEETEGIVVLEALAMNIPVLVRDIPVFDDWLTDGVNCYKAKKFKDFGRKVKGILEHKLPDVTEAGYNVAKSRNIVSIGKKLVAHYTSILNK